MIDTHAHLFWEDFHGEEEQVVQESIEAGVSAIIVPATNLGTLAEAMELAERFQSVFFTAGIHPQDVGGLPDDWLDRIHEALTHPKCVGVGEIGLDYYWKDHPPSLQQAALRLQLELALRVNKPVVLHNRDADEDILAICAEYRGERLRGQFHCFSSGEAILRGVLDLGFHVSFTGNITYRTSPLSEVAKRVPLDRLLLETDSPFMTPVPHRGKRNHPALVALVAERHAALRNLSRDAIAEATTRNAIRVFGLPEVYQELP